MARHQATTLADGKVDKGFVDAWSVQGAGRIVNTGEVSPIATDRCQLAFTRVSDTRVVVICTADQLTQLTAAMPDPGDWPYGQRRNEQHRKTLAWLAEGGDQGRECEIVSPPPVAPCLI